MEKKNYLCELFSGFISFETKVDEKVERITLFHSMPPVFWDSAGTFIISY